MDLQVTLADESIINLTAKCVLSAFWALKKRWEDAERLQSNRVQRSMQMGMEPHNPSLLTVINNLVYIFQQAGDRNPAGKLLLKPKEVDEEARGATHLTSLTITENRARTNRAQKR